MWTCGDQATIQRRNCLVLLDELVGERDCPERACDATPVALLVHDDSPELPSVFPLNLVATFLSSHVAEADNLVAIHCDEGRETFDELSQALFIAREQEVPYIFEMEPIRPLELVVPGRDLDLDWRHSTGN